MARPVETRFFEIPLTEDLPPNFEWIRIYHKNSEKLSQYILERGAQSTAYHAAIRCLKLLKNHLIETGNEYTPEIAMAWYEKQTSPASGMRATLNRLADIYQYGSVQPSNFFSTGIIYRNELHDSWKRILDGYVSSLSNKDCSTDARERHVAHFLYKLQMHNVQSPAAITIDILENHFNYDLHLSASSFSRYTYAVGRIIQYMADKGLCSHGLGWYPFFRMHNRILRLSDLAAEQIEKIETARIESLDFPSEEFAAVIPDFLDRFQKLGYSKAPCKVAKYSLLNLLLFLEMHGLGYHPAIASVWLENERRRTTSSGWKQSRRILHLFEVYVSEGDVIPELFFQEKPLLSDGLPNWCKTQLDSFMFQKEREGWASSTLCMYRSAATRFCLYLCSRGFSSFSEVDAASIAAFNRTDKHLSSEGKNAYNVRIRLFLQFLERNHSISYGLHLALFCTAANRYKTVVTLTKEEINEIQEVHSNCSTPMQLRSRAIILLGTKMGIRASDIVRIRIQSIDWEDQTICFIQEKTNHEIRLPMPTIVGNAIFLYLKHGRPQTESDYLFVKHRAPFNSMKRGVCLNALRATLPNRKVPQSGFHVTRKTYATERLQMGVSRQTISELLGQQDTSSLHHYLNLDSERMRQCPLTLEDIGLSMEGNRYGI